MNHFPFAFAQNLFIYIFLLLLIFHHFIRFNYFIYEWHSPRLHASDIYILNTNRLRMHTQYFLSFWLLVSFHLLVLHFFLFLFLRNCNLSTLCTIQLNSFCTMSFLLLIYWNSCDMSRFAICAYFFFFFCCCLFTTLSHGEWSWAQIQILFATRREGNIEKKKRNTKWSK